MNNKFVALPMLLLCIITTACVSPGATPQMTSLQIQAIQAKNFDADKKTTFNAVVSVLQDLGYIINSASFETGFITAESATQNDTGFFDALGGVRREQRVAVTASIEELRANQNRVRLNFVTRVKRSARNGQQANDDTPIQNQAIYQNAFEKIGEAVFIRKAL